MFGSDCKGEAVLYYLYMMADGEVSYSEEKIFDEIWCVAVVGDGLYITRHV